MCAAESTEKHCAIPFTALGSISLADARRCPPQLRPHQTISKFFSVRLFQQSPWNRAGNTTFTQHQPALLRQQKAGKNLLKSSAVQVLHRGRLQCIHWWHRVAMMAGMVPILLLPLLPGELSQHAPAWCRQNRKPSKECKCRHETPHITATIMIPTAAPCHSFGMLAAAITYCSKFGSAGNKKCISNHCLVMRA
jgi:hypothetical protein